MMVLKVVIHLRSQGSGCYEFDEVLGGGYDAIAVKHV